MCAFERSEKGMKFNMEIKDLDNFIKKLLELAPEKSKEKGTSVEELAFEFYKTIADNYPYGVPEDIYNVFIGNLPTFKQYVEDVMENLEKQKSNISMKKYDISLELKSIEEKLEGFEQERISVRENEVRTRTIRNKVYEGPRTHSFLRGDITPYHYETKTIEENVPSGNICQIKQILDVMVNEETIKDSKKLNEGLMSLYSMQVQSENGKKFILQDMHDMFIKKYPPFEEYLQQINGVKEEEKDLLQQKDIKQQQLTGLKEQESSIEKQIIRVRKKERKRRYVDPDPCSHGGHSC